MPAPSSPNPPAPNPGRQRWLLPIALVWLAAVVAGSGLLWRYAGIPGATRSAPARWPAGSALKRAPGLPTLVMMVHPRCPCTRASLGELAVIMTRAAGRVAAQVIFAEVGAAPGSVVEEAGLWQSAAAIPGVTPVHDRDGREAARFQATVSGQTLLYDAEGGLVFAGGITAARGHLGDNPGRQQVLAILVDGQRHSAPGAVFGCRLFGGAVASAAP